MNGTLHLRLVDLFENIKRRVRNLGASRSLTVGGLRRRLRAGIRSCLLGRGRLLVDTIFRAAVVYIGAFRGVINDFQALLDLCTLQYLAFCTLATSGVQSAWTVRLGIVSALDLAAISPLVLPDKVINSDNLDLSRSGMSLICRA